MSNNWTRPSNIDFPAVWSTFQIKHPKTGQTCVFQIKDLPEDRFDEAENIMIEHFLSEEEMCKSKGEGLTLIRVDGRKLRMIVIFCHAEISKDPSSLALARIYYREMIERKLTLICVPEGSDEIAGINVLDPVTKYDDKIELPEGTVRYL